MRRGELQSALDDFKSRCRSNTARQNATSISTTAARVQTLHKEYDAALADFAEAKQLNPAGRADPSNRCSTYAEMGKFDQALADCNERAREASEVAASRWPAAATSISPRAISMRR